jgi:hypothetical protein
MGRRSGRRRARRRYRCKACVKGRRWAAFFFARFFAAFRGVLLALFVFFETLRLARWAPTAFDECPTAATAAFNLAGVTLNFFD